MIPFLEKKKREKKKIIGVLTLFDGLQIFLKPSLDRHDIASTVGNELCLQKKKKKMVDNRFKKQRIHEHRNT